MSQLVPSMRDLVAASQQQLTAAGQDQARRQALLLAAALRQCEMAELMLHLDQPARADEAQRLDDLTLRLISGEPLAHVTGRAGFRHLELLSDSRALIPRPETESVVAEALRLMPSGVAVDIGTGTGAIALALRQEGRYQQVFGVDISAEALALASENGRRCGLVVEWRQGDLLEPLLSEGVRADLLVSNPPYLTEAEFAELEPSVRDYEPELALRSGADGLAATRRLIEEGARLLKPGGWLVLEVDANRATATAELAQRQGWSEVAVFKDLFDRPRTLVAKSLES